MSPVSLVLRVRYIFASLMQKKANVYMRSTIGIKLCVAIKA